MEQFQYKLNKDQQLCFNAAETTNGNYLFHGKPGVGKSVLIHALTSLGKKFYTLAAPTGLAALNINGRTLHSIFRLPVSQGIIHPTFNNFPNDDKVINFIRYQVKHLIIDEVSMVRADMFDYIDRLMQFAKDNTLPFGGAQVIAIGDFYQLPPVVVREEVPQLRNVGYSSPFIFSSRVFQNNFKIMFLDEVLRQKGDPKFIDLLHSARDGSMMPKQVKTLNARVGQPDDIRIKLTSTNREAEDINKRELAKIGDDYRAEVKPAILALSFSDPERSKRIQEIEDRYNALYKPTTFQATKFGEWPANPVEEVLELKIGAQVMVKMNGADRPDGYVGKFESQVVNGTLAKVVDLPEAGDDGIEKVIIETDEGEQITIYRKRWERKVKIKNSSDKWEEKVVASYEQMPLALAWAISIHKSQGQSFDKAHIVATKIFAPGQMYVALSRLRTMDGLSLDAPLTTAKFFANRDVINFFEEVETA